MPDRLRQLKLAEKVVVLGASTPSFVYLNKHTRLGCQRIFGGNGGVTLDERGHDTSGSLDTLRKRGNIEEKKILSRFRGVTSSSGGLATKAQRHVPHYDSLVYRAFTIKQP